MNFGGFVTIDQGICWLKWFKREFLWVQTNENKIIIDPAEDFVFSQQF